MLTDSRGIPLAKEFAGDHSLTIFEVLTAEDDAGRAMLRAYWLTDQPWVPGGVRAQVYTTNVTEWCCNQLAAGRTLKTTAGKVVDAR